MRRQWLTAKAVVGLFPANSVSDNDIEVYADENRQNVLTTLHHLRQQQEKADNKPNYCLADFIAPKSTGLIDAIGAFAVTAGIGIEEHVARFEAQHDDYNAIMLKALADRLADRGLPGDPRRRVDQRGLRHQRLRQSRSPGADRLRPR